MIYLSAVPHTTFTLASTLLKVTTRNQLIVNPPTPLWQVQRTDFACTVKRRRHATVIGELSDEVLLEIFDLCRTFYTAGMQRTAQPETVWNWHTLVHVCQRWRQIIFASPLRLNLQILCKNGTPVRKNLDIWPTFPIVIEYIAPLIVGGFDEDNVIAALEHPDRVRSICFHLTDLQLGMIAAVMQEPFPALKHIFMTYDGSASVLPCEFLGRSAPCLREIYFKGISFPALPLLLPSTTDLITLELRDIPQTGYISPEAMVAGLATLIRLESLEIGFRSPNSRPDQIRLPPPTRTVLPALTSVGFHGVREYLEDFVAQIDTPLLRTIYLYYFNQLVDFEVPQLSRFIDRLENLKAPMCCSIQFRPGLITFSARDSRYTNHGSFRVDIGSEGIDWQVSHLTQALSQIPLILSHMVHSSIYSDSIMPKSEEMDDIEWLQLLRQFSSVKTLFVSRDFTGHISRALEDISGVMSTEILPALDMLCLEDRPASSVNNFLAIRRNSGHPVTIVKTEAGFDEIR